MKFLFTNDMHAEACNASKVQWPFYSRVQKIAHGHRYITFPTWGDAIATTAGVGISVGTNGVYITEHTANYIPAVLVWSGTLTGWNHIAVVYQNKQPKLYVNGMLVKTGNVSVKAVFPGYNIGGGNHGVYHGLVDELHIWGKPLTAAEIKEGMNKQVVAPKENLELYYTFDAVKSNVIADGSGNGYTLPLTTTFNAVYSSAPIRLVSYKQYYRYGFNGKENDNDVKGVGNQQDYGFRIYDPRIGKFLSVDPLRAKYPFYSTYQFSGNNPIRFVDLDGLEPANNPKAPGASEKEAMNVINGIETMAARNDAKTNIFSRGAWLTEDQDIKGSYYCAPNGTYVTDTKGDPTNKYNMKVFSGSTLNVDESQASHFDNYEAFITHRLMTNFVTGEGAENYNFPTNGIMSSKFLNSDIVKNALRDFKSGKLKSGESVQYPFGAKELGKDLAKTGTLFSITGLVGSGTITIVPNKDGIQLKIFNITSLTSGDLFKNPTNDANWPKSYVRDPAKTTPFGNISQTFSIFIPNDNK